MVGGGGGQRSNHAAFIAFSTGITPMKPGMDFLGPRKSLFTSQARKRIGRGGNDLAATAAATPVLGTSASGSKAASRAYSSRAPTARAGGRRRPGRTRREALQVGRSGPPAASPMKRWTIAVHEAVPARRRRDRALPVGRPSLPLTSPAVPAGAPRPFAEVLPAGGS